MNTIQKGKYCHYKGHLYEVTGTARHSETLEDMVIYKALYGDFEIWVRPLKMFLEDIEVNGKIQKRFEFVENESSKEIHIDALKIVVDHNPSTSDNGAVMEELISSNELVMGEPRDKEFSVFLKNDSGNVLGGIQAHFDKESVYIEALWVDEKLRKQGYSSKLMSVSEQEALKHGCIFSITDTLDFQAEDFYLKNGYQRIGEIKKYWHEHSSFFLKKVL